MASLNIPSTVDDPNYRYKMPAVRCKVEGSGNGIKTNHMNMRDVATALKRSPEYLTKFLACELCVHGRYFDDEGKAIFQGVHSADSIAAKIDAFIKAYVLCPQCGLPEIDLVVEKKVISGKCNACGGGGKVNNIHRVAAYIIKNPPQGSTIGGKSTKEDKKAAKDKKKSGVDEADKGDAKKVDDGKKKKKVVKKVVKKKKKLDDHFNLNGGDANMVMVRLAEKKNEPGNTPALFFQEVRTVQLLQAFSNVDRFFLSLGALFGVGVTLGDEDTFSGTFNKVSVETFKDVMPFLCAVAFDSPNEALEALELFMFKHATDESYKAHYPLVLKEFYDQSIVDDDDVIEHYGKDCDGEAFVKAKNVLKPLLEWLADAESDSYESDD